MLLATVRHKVEPARPQDAALHLEGIGLDEQEPETLIEYIGRAGVVGLGGAAFPTAVKLSRGRAQPVDTLIINGVECEPYITCDDVLMRYYPHEIIRGIGYLQRILAPARTVIAIEDNKPDALAAMRNALGNHPLPETTIACIPTRYPSGGEKQLVQIISGQQVPQGKLAMDIGFYCQNIGTCMAIAQALDHHQPLTSRIVTLTGNNINSPGNWEVRLGTPIAHLVEQAGGYRHPAPRLFMGGPLMGFSLPGDNIPITKASHCVLAMQSGTTLNSQDQHNECIRCGKCNEVCPASLLPQQLYWHARSRAYEQIQDYHLFDCIECGCCAVVCPSQIPLVQYYRASKSEIRAQHKAALKSNRARERFEFRERRLAQRKQQEETRRRLKREALQKKRTTTGQTITPDPVKAALERVKARKQTSPTETR